MTKRCKHKHLMTKPDYPDDIICEDCQTIWTISEYMYMNPKQLMTLPLFIRREVLKRQVEQFNKENPDYYKELV